MLEEYAKKRRFEKTPEPKPGAGSNRVGALTFVVQKHAASHLHYDFRLEVDGVLASWAVPKGPSLNPADRRLAMKVEDHPLEYGGFEGFIPQGEYGGGQVIIWDRGTYSVNGATDKESDERLAKKGIESGKLDFTLFGEKLDGKFLLIHTRDRQWLLIKRHDEQDSEEDVLAQDRSVVSGERIGGVPDEHAITAADKPKPAPLPEIAPMLLSDGDKPFNGKDWTFELKLDGIRALAFVEGSSVRLVTRNGNDLAPRFNLIASELGRIGLSQSVLDGEIVYFDENGRPSFQGLMDTSTGSSRSAVFNLFDDLVDDGRDLRREPWKARRAALEALRIGSEHLKVMDTFPEDGQLLYDHAIELGFEGVVAERTDSVYRSGVRSKDWLKIKGFKSDEFLVAGYTKGKGARAASFGALVLATPTDEGLTYVGNVGGGFDDAALTTVLDRLEHLRQKEPTVEIPKTLKDVAWVKPELVAEVKYMAKTTDGRLRFPTFLRLRPDKEAELSTDGEARSGGELSKGGEQPVLGNNRSPSGRSQADEADRNQDRATEPSAKKPASNPSNTDKLTDVLAALNTSEKDLVVPVNGEPIKFTNLQKELWPGVTKRNLAIYYATVSETLLKYLRDRPMSFVRCPEGIHGERFFQKHWDKGRPAFVETVPIYSGSNSRPTDYVLCQNLQTIVWLAQIAVVELNPWNSRVVSDDPDADTDFSSSKSALEESILNYPDYLVFDLDPHFGGKATGWKKPEWDRLVETALVLKEILDGINLKAFPKSSGKSGLHLFVPLDNQLTYSEVRAAATTFGQFVIQRLGGKVTLEWNTNKRPDAVFIDANQNVRGKTMAAAYSPRAAEGAGVSMPLTWKELTTVDPTEFTVLTAPRRLAQKGDVWAEMLSVHQHLAF